MKPKLTKVQSMSHYRLFLAYDDGVAGEVDLSEFVGKGVFKKWSDPVQFDKVRLGRFNEILWDGDIDVCGDALYLRLTGKTLDQVFGSKKESAA